MTRRRPAFRPRLVSLEDRAVPAVILSDNLANPVSGTEAASGARWLASSFATDGSAHSLTSVTLRLSAPAGTGTAAVSVYTDAADQPGTSLGTLTSPAAFSTTLADTTFTSGGIGLAADTIYWVVLSAPAGDFNWSFTADPSGTGAGPFQHTRGVSADAGATWVATDTLPLQMRVTADEVVASPGILAFSAAAYAVSEGGGSVTVTVTRTGGSSGAVSVPVTASGGSATTGADFTGLPATATFAAGATTATVVIPITNDALVEGDETIELALGTPTGGATLGGQTTSVVTIADDDTGVAFASGTYSAGEGAGTATITLVRAGDRSAATSVTLSAVGGTASAADYSGLPVTVTFAAGAATASVAIPITNDALVEGDETLVLGLSGATGGAVVGTPGTATLTITDDDSAFAFANAAAAVGEGAGTLALTVVRTGDRSTAATVGVIVTGGTASAADYSGLPTTIIFAAGQSTATISLVLTDDDLVEGDETLVIGLANPTGGATLGSPASDTITIVDDDTPASPGVISVADVAVTAGEGGGPVTVRLVRTGGLSGAVSVTVTATGGTATAGADFTFAPATVTFADGQAAADFTVTPLDDNLVEGAETILFALGSPTGGATLGAATQAVLTLADDDVAGPVQFAVSDYQVDEAAGTVTLTVTRTGATASPGTVDFATAPGTAGTGDYTPTTGTLTFAAGQVTATLTVPILQDALAEGPETFTVTLSNATGGAVLGSPATGTVTILDEAATVGFASNAAVGEDAGSVTLTVARTGTLTAAGTVDYTTLDGAGAGVDFTPTSGTLTFAPGQATATITVPILDNDTRQGDRTFALLLSNVTGELTLGPASSAVVTILDDEAAQAGVISFAAGSYTAGEGDGTATVTLTRAGGTDGAVSVTLSVVGGTAGAADFGGLPVVVTFAPGQATATATISLTDDTAVEGDETVLLALGDPTGGAVIGGPSPAVLTITDNDVASGAGVIAFAVPNFAVTEGDRTLVLQLLRTGGSVGTVTVLLSAVGGTTALGALPSTVTFGPGQTSATVTLPVQYDFDGQGTTTIPLSLSNPTGGAALGDLSVAGVTLTDIDTPDPGPATVTFTSPTYTVAENGRTLTVFLTRSGNTAAPLTVTVSATGGTATAGADYTGLPATVTFGSRQSFASFTLTIRDDNLIEGAETISLAVAGSTAAATVTITDREELLAVGAGSGSPTVVLYDAGGAVVRTFQAFAAGVTGGVRVATADVTGDGYDDVIVGSGPGTSSLVKVFDGRTGAELASFAVFEASFLGGVYVAAGDMDGDGKAEVVVTPDEGGGPVVAIYSGAGLGTGVVTQLVRFFGIEDPAFRGGARAAVGDMTGDGRADLLVSAGFQGGPRVAMFDGATVAPGQASVKLRPDFFAFEDTLRNGAFVGLADLDGDGRAELIFGGGPGGGPRVRVFGSAVLLANPALGNLDAVAVASPGSQAANFFAGDPTLRGGVRVSGGDLDGNGVAEIVTGSGQGERSAVRAYRYATARVGATPDYTLDPFGLTLAGGVFVG